MKNSSVFLCSLIFLLVAISSANATLITIGTAQFNGTGTSYNLIWDDNNHGNSVVWLDYTNAPAMWYTQRTWAKGLGSALTINLDGYTVDWGTEFWRLPQGSSSGSGYSVIQNANTEMGDLFYNELKLTSFPDRGNNLVSTAELNISGFEHLVASRYWSGTEYMYQPLCSAWFFDMSNGGVWTNDMSEYINGLAVRSGKVSAVPEPGAIWLLGSGLIGLVGARRKLKK